MKMMLDLKKLNLGLYVDSSPGDSVLGVQAVAFCTLGSLTKVYLTLYFVKFFKFMVIYITGNYTMFELIRPVVPGEYGRDERVYGRPEPPLVESAWERGLRTAKEMLRKSVKRKEQDIDFEEKKMNLSLAQEEFDKENGYYGRGPSPEPR